MRLLFLLLILFSITSCWTRTSRPRIIDPYVHVWGNKPVYAARTEAKTISYLDSALPVIIPGNIYVKGNFIYQLEIGKGIHVIDKTNPAQAERIGFITVNGSSQISIKDNYLYTNNYDDLVVIDISNSGSVSIIKRVAGAFPEGVSNYFYIEPIESGYYECPRYDSVVVSWVKDSIWTSCSKN